MPSRGAQAREDRMFHYCKDLLRKFYREEYVGMVQEIPATSGSEAPTTCRCADCVYPNAIMPPGSYRISVEKRPDTDPKFYCLPYEPIASFSRVRQTPPGPRGQYGLGKNGQEWICVPCFEAMLLTYRQRMQRDNPGMTFLPSYPIYELAYYIFAEDESAADESDAAILADEHFHSSYKKMKKQHKCRLKSGEFLEDKLYSLYKDQDMEMFSPLLSGSYIFDWSTDRHPKLMKSTDRKALFRDTVDQIASLPQEIEDIFDDLNVVDELALRQRLVDLLPVSPIHRILIILSYQVVYHRSKMSIGIAIIGAEIIARQEHLPAVQATLLFCLKAIYSRSKASADKLAESAATPVKIYYDLSITSSNSLAGLLARE